MNSDDFLASTLPTLVVVGRVNEGKTSIVSTLVEDDAAKVGPEPGTTTEARTYVIAPEGKALLRVIDTPGFQEPERCLKWLMTRAANAAQRPAAVQAFLDTFSGKQEFEDEWRLLAPVVAEGFILYVVDASHPYRKSYESEMEILRWTGRPAIALLNRAGSGSNETEWRQALQQHFNAVRGFNAHTAGFADRLSLLSLLAELDERLRSPLRAAITSLESERDRRIQQVAAVIADAVLEIVGLRTESTIRGEAATEVERDTELLRYRQRITQVEAASRRRVEQLFRHEHIQREESGIEPKLLHDELFVGEAWEFFGLSKTQLIISGTLAGALGGIGLDAATVGHSFGLGAALGASVGATGTAILSLREPRATIKLAVAEIVAGQRKLVVGPTEHPNFPWVVLGRAVYHARLLRERPHARREPLLLRHEESSKPLAAMTPKLRKDLGRVFQKARRGRVDSEARAILRSAVHQLIEAEPAHAPPLDRLQRP